MKASSVRIIDGVLYLAVATASLYFIYLISVADEIAWIPINIAVLGVVPGLTLGGVVLCFRASHETRTMVAIALVTTIASLYAAELYMTLGLDDEVPLLADRRSKLDVVLDLRKEAVDAYPTIHSFRIAIPSFQVGERRVTFLSGVRNVTTVYCDESGEYSIYESDEYGFRNPRGAWSMDELDIALLGDSYTHGACVPEGQDVGSWVRKSYRKTLNLGYGGNDPLLMLAGVREYLADMRPKVVVWIQASVDLGRSDHTSKSPILLRYLDDPDYRQGLMQMQPEIDRALRTFIDGRAMDEARARKKTLYLQFLKLSEIRHRLGAIAKPVSTEKVPMERRLELFRNALGQAVRAVRGWGGELYFVYLVGGGRLYYSRELQGATSDNWREKCRNGDIPAPACIPEFVSSVWARERLIEIAESFSVPTIDFTRVTDAHPNPRSLLALGVPNHLSGEGYRLLARTILDRLEQDFAISATR